MNFSEVLKALNQASAFELYRMQVAIGRLLADPRWADAIRGQLRIGQVIEYFDGRANAAHQAQILELRRTQALVLNLATQKRWLVRYASINIGGRDVQIREQPQHGLGRNEVAIGEVLGFLDSDQQQRSGKVIRLNDKTVTLAFGGQKWRGGYTLLHGVVDGRPAKAKCLNSGRPARKLITERFDASPQSAGRAGRLSRAGA